MFGYSQATIERRAEKREQTVDEHLAYLRTHRKERRERNRILRENAKNSK